MLYRSFLIYRRAVRGIRFSALELEQENPSEFLGCEARISQEHPYHGQSTL